VRWGLLFFFIGRQVHASAAATEKRLSAELAAATAHAAATAAAAARADVAEAAAAAAAAHAAVLEARLEVMETKTRRSVRARSV
jgi:hypothetical protein